MAKRTDDDWRKLLGEYRADKEPVSLFCQRHQVSVSSYYSWSAKLSGQQRSPVNMLPVVVPEPRAIDDAVELLMPKGMALRFSPGASARYVADIIRALV